MENVWQEIKLKLPVEDVIQDYIRVQTTGGGYRAVCPFHREKTPSLMINSELGVWHCFGCGAGGDIFEFVCQIENCTKKEALEKLAAKAGVTLKKLEKRLPDDSNEPSPQELDSMSSGFKLLDWTAQVYHKVLLKLLADRSHPVTQYCLKRGWSQETIVKFKLGYAPKGNLILELAKKHGLNIEVLAQAGLLKLKDDQIDIQTIIRNHNFSQIKDKFSDRLTVPIMDIQGRVVGFTGRILDYDTSERPKYLNSPQTPWFNKSQIWFGLNLAKRSILQSKKALVLEGNMDVIAAFQYGYDFAVASQGTSFTVEQLKLLKKHTKTIWLAFDNDEAGVVSGKKLFLQATKLGFTVLKVIIDPKYKDIDEYLKSEPETELRVQNYPDWLMQKLQYNLLNTQADVQRAGVLEMLEIFSVLDDLGREQYLRKLSQFTHISFNTLVKQIEPMLKVNSNSSHEFENVTDDLVDETIPLASKEQETFTVWQNYLAGMVFNDDMFEKNRKVLEKMHFILHKLLPSLKDYPKLDDFINSQKTVLQLISKEKSDIFTQYFYESAWSSMVSYIDSRLSSLLFEEDLYNIYKELKINTVEIG